MDFEARIKALGLEFSEALARKLEDAADRHGCTVDVVLRLLERHKQIRDQREIEQPNLDVMLRTFAPEPIMLRNRPSYELKTEWTPPPRRSSKRAQRARERPWQR
jgi:hypothetical protein